MTDSHFELYAAIIGALIGSTVGGLISFSLSFHEAKTKLSLEKTKLYERLKFSIADVIACFQGALENPERWNSQQYKDEGLKEMHKWLEAATTAQDTCSDSMSQEMGLISHFLSVKVAETFNDFFVSPMQSTKIQSTMPILDYASTKMLELSALECNFSRTILNSNFFEYCLFLLTPNRRLSKWKKLNKPYLDGLSKENQRSISKSKFI